VDIQVRVRLIVVLTFLIVGSTIAAAADKGCATNQQGCDINRTVYENRSTSTVVVSIELTDGCPDAESYVEVYGKSAPPLGPIIAKGTVPDMTTSSFTFDVPPSGIVRFNCRGKGAGHGSVGGCSWRVVSAVPR
jgi:hypothetical protein